MDRRQTDLTTIWVKQRWNSIRLVTVRRDLWRRDYKHWYREEKVGRQIMTIACYVPRWPPTNIQMKSMGCGAFVLASVVFGAAARQRGSPGAVGRPPLGLRSVLGLMAPVARRNRRRREISCLPSGLLSSSWRSHRPTLLRSAGSRAASHARNPICVR